MPDRLSVSAADAIEWKFQVEQQGFITRYGSSGGFFWKQVVLQPGHVIPVYPIKRIDERIYKTALSLSKVLE